MFACLTRGTGLRSTTVDAGHIQSKGKENAGGWREPSRVIGGEKELLGWEQSGGMGNNKGSGRASSGVRGEKGSGKVI